MKLPLSNPRSLAVAQRAEAGRRATKVEPLIALQSEWGGRSAPEAAEITPFSRHPLFRIEATSSSHCDLRPSLPAAR